MFRSGRVDHGVHVCAVAIEVSADSIPASVPRIENVVAVVAEQPVMTAAAPESVAMRCPRKSFPASTAQIVCTPASPEDVVPPPTTNHIGSHETNERIVSGSAQQEIPPVVAVQVIVSASAYYNIGPASGNDRVVPCTVRTTSPTREEPKLVKLVRSGCCR